MRKVIEINALEPSDFTAAADLIDEYIRSLDDKNSKFLETLSANAARSAEQKYNSAIASADAPVSSVGVSSFAVGDRSTITAYGPDLGFIEFGTGLNPEWGVGGYPADFDPPKHGSWSWGPEGKGHWNQVNGWFTPEGHHTRGLYPAEGMLSAWRYIVEHSADEARREFGK